MGAETCQYGCWQFVAWSLRYGGGSDTELGSQNRICFRLQWPWSPCVANWTAQILHGPNSRCIGRKKNRTTQSARAALWAGVTPSASARAKFVGCGSVAQGALSAWAAIAWSIEWAALPTNLPSTCHALPTQCNGGSTRVDRNRKAS